MLVKGFYSVVPGEVKCLPSLATYIGLYQIYKNKSSLGGDAVSQVAILS